MHVVRLFIMEQNEIDVKYMRRALQLAASVNHAVAPNPMVGAVIVCDDTIVGEGFHACYGGPHAEVNAIASVKDLSVLTRSTLYVTLEPCSHYGKTPPCVDLVLEKKIPRVVIGSRDPNPRVAGRGIQKLRKAGVDVRVDVLKEECEELNRRFFWFHTACRPYVILKWAQTADGYIDRKREDNTRPALKISTNETLQLVHKLRSEVDAIMVGTRTALLDNPSLTNRYWAGKSPLRIAIDRNGAIPEEAHLKDGTVPTLILTEQPKTEKENLTYLKVNFSRNILDDLFNYMAEQNIQSLLVEGGTQLLQSFIDADYWNEAVVETDTSLRIGEGVKAPSWILPKTMAGCRCVDNHLFTYYRNNVRVDRDEE